MSTQGPNNPGTLANLAGVGFAPWSTPAGAATADNTGYATFSGSGVQSNYLKATNFGFTVPAGATIQGVTVGIERKAANATGSRNVRDAIVSLVKNNAIQGDNKAATGTNWPTAEAAANYGGTNDLWGLSLSATDVNASTFGVVLSATMTGSTTASVDVITVTITYSVSVTHLATATLSGTSSSTILASVTSSSHVGRNRSGSRKVME